MAVSIIAIIISCSNDVQDDCNIRCEVYGKQAFQPEILETECKGWSYKQVSLENVANVRRHEAD